jgi:hypothetical protein
MYKHNLSCKNSPLRCSKAGTTLLCLRPPQCTFPHLSSCCPAHTRSYISRTCNPPSTQHLSGLMDRSNGSTVRACSRVVWLKTIHSKHALPAPKLTTRLLGLYLYPPTLEHRLPGTVAGMASIGGLPQERQSSQVERMRAVLYPAEAKWCC